MSLIHLGTGSTCPPFIGKLRLYSSVFCPFAQRTRLVLAHKKIPYETVNIKLKKKPEWYAAINSSKLVPTLQIDSTRKLSESLIISEYLDNTFSHNNIIPSDPYEYAVHKLIVRASYTQLRYFYKLAKRVDSTCGPLINDELEKFCRVDLKGRKFVGGDRPMFADFMLWPWLERLEYLEKYREFKLDTTKLQQLVGYMERMKEVAACKELLLSPEDHDRHIESLLDNEEAEYDHGIKIK